MENTSNRPRVFVSSTIRDFRDLRSALKYWLEDLGLEVRMSEFNDFVRRPEQATFESCFESIKDCDYYILLVGGRKGSEFTSGVSVTQQEFRVAVSLARRSLVKPIVFLRREVQIALAERKQLTRSRSDTTSEQDPSSVNLKNPEFVRAFLSEIESTDLQREGSGGPAGTMWVYQFGDFRDLVDALSVNLRLYASVRRKALLTNLKWELEENVSALSDKRKGLPSPRHSHLTRVRNHVQLTSADAMSQLELSRDDAAAVATFWMALPSADRLAVTALQEAISSGEFLIYRPELGRPTSGPLLDLMQSLLSSVRWYQRIAVGFHNHLPRLEPVFSAVKSGQPRVPVMGEDLLYLFRLHDLMADILRFSASLIAHILDPDSPLTATRVSPSTPIKEEIGRLATSQAAHEDIERWTRDPYLLGLLSREYRASPDQVQAAFEKYQVLDDIMRADVDRVVGEFREREASQGRAAAESWLLQQLGRKNDNSGDPPAAAGSGDET